MQRDRLRVVLLAGDGDESGRELFRVELTRRVGLSRSSVDQWVGRYRSGGLDGRRALVVQRDRLLQQQKYPPRGGELGLTRGTTGRETNVQKIHRLRPDHLVKVGVSHRFSTGELFVKRPSLPDVPITQRNDLHVRKF